MKAKIKLKDKEIEIENIKKIDGLKLFFHTGLMFKSKNTGALLFEFSSPTNTKIHSFFCNPFLAIWLDEKNKIIETKFITKVGTFSPKTEFSKILELPLNKNYISVIKILMNKEKV
jgi:hypothetical protein